MPCWLDRNLGSCDGAKLIFDVLQQNAPKKSTLISTVSTPGAMISLRPACDRPYFFAYSKSRRHQACRYMAC